jgi:hypothetical protein
MKRFLIGGTIGLIVIAVGIGMSLGKIKVPHIVDIAILDDSPKAIQVPAPIIEEEKVASYVMAVAQNVADLKMSVDSAHKKEAAKKPVVALENFQCSYFAYLFWQRDDYLIVL